MSSKSDVYACFLDLSKAFDSVDHEMLIEKLHDCGIPGTFVDIIEYWYGNQWASVKFMSSISLDWKICNGVRQGGVLSSLFFCIYIDSLIDKISSSNYGCTLGMLTSNIIVYADDLVILAPSAGSLQMLIDLTVNETKALNLQVNEMKTKCMVFRHHRNDKNLKKIKPFTIRHQPIEFVASYKYLGFVIMENMSIKDDVNRALNKFYIDINMILRKFSFAEKKM